VLLSITPCDKDDNELIERSMSLWKEHIAALLRAGVMMHGQRRAVRLFLMGDMAFLCTFRGHSEASAQFSCIYCTQVRARSAKNVRLVKRFCCMQDTILPAGRMRTMNEAAKKCTPTRH